MSTDQELLRHARELAEHHRAQAESFKPFGANNVLTAFHAKAAETLGAIINAHLSEPQAAAQPAMSTKPTTERRLLEQARNWIDEATTYTESPAWSPSISTEGRYLAAEIDSHLSKAPPMNEDDAAFARMHP